MLCDLTGPFKTYMYGIANAPATPYRIRLSRGFLTEFPPGTFRFAGQTVPFSGGVYFRVLPLALILHGFRTLAKHGHAAIFYTHPWELDTGAPRIQGLSHMESLIHYSRMAGMPRRLRRFLREFAFVTLEEFRAQNALNEATYQVVDCDQLGSGQLSQQVR
jgi:hypothetical protein